MTKPSPSQTRIVWFKALGRDRHSRRSLKGAQGPFVTHVDEGTLLPRGPCLGVKTLCIKTERYTSPVKVAK